MVLCMWVLSYMDGAKVDAFFNWGKSHAGYLLIIEPIDRDMAMGEERFLDEHQQMIVRHPAAY